ncbi:FHA domain-containing protein [Frankia sp. AiPa1]|uniref:FHA domain-containing protein n=1 Tax=Frankia sp. AiPa1 TaxID=573492 RepID=UPI00202B13A7|nr:FHA domain-containing protein [Frankia sp. AiPa1]MCL9761048.1 FHA domain-containing protein [Frankia sp. AiPa1]
MQALRIITPSGEAVLPPERDHVIGRGRDCDVVISDGRVSRHHLRLEPTADGWLARDISSSGIWVGGSRTSTVALRDGEIRVHLGATDGPLVTLIPPPPPAPPTSPDAGQHAAAGPNGPDPADQETMLAGSGAPVPIPPTQRTHPPTPPPEAPAPARGGTPGRQRSPALAGWLRLLPTLVWLAAVGFFLGALVALS